MSTRKLSNKQLLRIASALFLAFALAEVIGAFKNEFYSSRDLLLFDAVTKIIVVTSLQANSVAEYIRERTPMLEIRAVLWTQVKIPAFSLLALIFTIVVTSVFSVRSIMLHSSMTQTDYLAAYFASNMILDITCFLLFWTGGRELFFQEPNDEISRVDRAFNLEDGEFGKIEDDLDFSLVSSSDLVDEDHLALRIRDFLCPSCVSVPTQHLSSSLSKNVNMVSAICHLSLDSIRAITNLVASGTAIFLGLDVLASYAWSSVAALSIGLLFIAYPLAKDILNASKEAYNDHGIYRKVTEDEAIDDYVV